MAIPAFKLKKKLQERIEADLADLGWKRDTYGNIVNPNKNRRVHFSKIKVHLEAKVVVSGVWKATVANRWYFKDITEPVFTYIKEWAK
jgi:uncharacterized membrane protein